MKTKKNFTALLWAGLFLLTTHALQGQTNYSFKIIGTDGFYMDSVLIGLHSNASYAYENVVWAPGDTTKETETPPPPLAGVFNFRSADLPGRQRAEGSGCNFDIRGSSGVPLQRDTIKLAFQSSDSTGSQPVTFSWPSNLLSVGYGGFRLEDASPAADLGSPLFPPVDMTTQTSFQYPYKSAAHNQFVRIIIGNGYRFRTFPADSIAKAVDSKGARKAENPKGSGSEWTLVFTNPTSGRKVGPGNGIYIMFSQKVTLFTSSVNIDPIPRGTANKFHLMTGTIQPGQSYTVSGRGDQGKFMTAKAYFTIGTYASPPVKPVQVSDNFNATSTYNRITLKQPNINNILNELYFQHYFPIDVGAASSFKRITQPKPADVIKTMAKQNRDKTFLLHTGTPRCFHGTEGIYKWDAVLRKPYTDAPPDKYNNKLVAEQLALKINLRASIAGKIPVGLGTLVVNTTNPELSKFNGQLVDSIASKVDLYLSTCDTTEDIISFTGSELFDLLHQINGEFRGHFDTSGGGHFAVFQSLRPLVASTSLPGVKSALMSSLLAQVVPPGLQPEAMGKVYQPDILLPEVFTLMQNYPNPFNPITSIEFTLPEDAVVTLKVYNILGQEVATLADRELFSGGDNTIEFNASHLASGVYFYRMIANDNQNSALKYQQVRKMILLK